jgi:hypothetical protein
MSLTMPLVAKNKDKAVDRHKPSRMVRVPEALAQALEGMALEQFNSLAEQVKIAVREYLEKHGRLPKPGKKPG